jgi:hypothetical protein
VVLNGPATIGRTRHGNKDGFALIAVLWILTLLALVSTSFSLQTRFDDRIAHNFLDVAVARSAADAGIQRAILDLWTPPDARKFPVDGSIYLWSFRDSKVYISIQDEATKVDLNQASVERLSALFETLGLGHEKAQSLADAIVDFRDPDNLIRLQGAHIFNTLGGHRLQWRHLCSRSPREGSVRRSINCLVARRSSADPRFRHYPNFPKKIAPGRSQPLPGPTSALPSKLEFSCHPATSRYVGTLSTGRQSNAD